VATPAVPVPALGVQQWMRRGGRAAQSAESHIQGEVIGEVVDITTAEPSRGGVRRRFGRPAEGRRINNRCTGQRRRQGQRSGHHPAQLSLRNGMGISFGREESDRARGDITWSDPFF
jgi:hypothetical protein